jgi:hypothetical protein
MNLPINKKAFNDKESRKQALSILNDLYPDCNCIKSYDKSYWDIECNNFYVDVKEIKQYLSNPRTKYLGINKEAYDKYIQLDKPVYILFILYDGYILIDIKNEYTEWTGTVSDNVYGEKQKTIYNFSISKAIMNRIKGFKD